MKNQLRRSLLVLLMMSLISLGACGGEDGEADKNQTPPGEEQDENDDNGGELISECDGNEEAAWSIDIPSDYEAQEFEADYDLMMDKFAFIPGSPGTRLNGILDMNIKNQDQNYPVVIILELRDIDVDAGTFQVRGGAGLKAGNDGDYRWDGELDIPDFSEGEIHESGALYAELPSLSFVATMESDTDVYKTIIPIRDLELEGRLELSDDGGKPVMVDAMLRGIVIGEEAKDVEVELPGSGGIMLPQALGQAQMNYDKTCDGRPDSWQMTAKFSALEVSLVE